MNETSNEILLYQSADGQRVEVQLRGDTLWLALSGIQLLQKMQRLQPMARPVQRWQQA